VIFGLTIVSYSTYVMGSFGTLTSFFVMTVWMTVRGGGMAFCFMPITTAGMNAIPQHLVGRASALSNVIRQVAASFGCGNVYHYYAAPPGLPLGPTSRISKYGQQYLYAYSVGLSGIAISQNWAVAQAQGVGLGS